MARRRSSGQRNAARVVYEALGERNVPGELRILRTVFLGEGLTYRTWGVEVEWVWRGERQAYMGVVARIPHRDSEEDQPERAGREEALLRHLATLDPPFEIPEPIALVKSDVHGRPRLSVVQGWVEGIPLNFKVAGIEGDRPWEVVARVAAFCHRLNPEPLTRFLPGYSTRRDHAFASLDEVVPPSAAELAPLRAWGEGHLPPATPARLLHGDLLGQNLIQRIFVDRPEEAVALPLGVIDWEYAELGDPAFDLAIATRGHRRPFRGGGLRDLVESYNRLAPEPVQLHEVRLHELCILAHAYRAARDEDNGGAAENELHHINNLIGESG